MKPWWEENLITLYHGDNRLILPTLPSRSVNSVVTSPPYWGLRDYGIPASVWGGDDGCEHEWGDTIVVNSTNHTAKARWQHTRNGRDEEQPIEKRVAWLRTDVPQGKFCQKCGAWAGALGLEPSPELFVEHTVLLFREVWRVLRDDGTLWLNLGDSYSSGGRDSFGTFDPNSKQATHAAIKSSPRPPQPDGLKPKDLVGIPWMVAFALRADGWYLRQDIIWHKPNPMPESVTDRCTKAHEYIFLLSKSEKYHCDMDAIAEDCAASSLERWDQDIDGQAGSNRVPGKTNGTMKAVGGPRKVNGGASFGKQNHDASGTGAQSRTYERHPYEKRNRRSVWTVPTKSFREAHFATFPPDLIQPCIRAGVPDGGVCLDPFFGAGTTGLVCQQQHVRCIGIELNDKYCEIAKKRLGQGVLFGANT